MEYQRYAGDLSRLQPEEGRSVILSGVTLPVLAHLLARLINDRPQTIFAALPTAAMAEDLAGDVGFFWPEGRGRIHFFPAFEAKPFLAQAAAPDTALERQWILAKLAEDDGPRLVAAPAPALLRLAPGPAEALAASRLLEAGTETDLEDLKTFLVRHGYTSVGQVESPGDFAARGYIVDIFPAGQRLPVRVEFFGDLVESLRTFQVEDQKSVSALPSLLITPAREFAYDAENGAAAANTLEKLALEAGWHSLLWGPLAESFQAGTPFSGLDSWAPLFTELKPLASGLGRARVLIHEPENFMKSAEAAWLGLTNHYERLRLEERPHLDLRRGFQIGVGFRRKVKKARASVPFFLHAQSPGPPASASGEAI
jgi:transcription-repair coupling factor (superfamily II helicase)